MRNVDVAHDFFYHEGRTFDRSSMTVSYRNNIFYSYSTAIGQITEDRTGRKVCIISNDEEIDLILASKNKSYQTMDSLQQPESILAN